MRKPVAQPVTPEKPGTPPEDIPVRLPQAFPLEKISEEQPDFTEAEWETVDLPPAPRRNWALRVASWALGLVVSLSFGLWAQRFISLLFYENDWLGWVGTGLVAALVLSVLAVAWREWRAVRRLTRIGRLREKAVATLESDSPEDGKDVSAKVAELYAKRSDMARAEAELEPLTGEIIDGSTYVETTERVLMASLDKRARALTAAAARRVTLVTAISPRAVVDIAFVAWESMRLARAVATLYGVRPGLFGTWRLFGNILGHLAVTGGIALGDSVIQQLLGQGLAARLSARLGEGLVNGLMTVRVGIAAMRVTRPLPFSALRQPMVMDFVPELAKVEKGEKK